MESEHIEQIRQIPKTDNANELKLKKKKEINKLIGKPCIYAKETECRIPFCDLETCVNCPEGHVYCMEGSPNPLKTMLHKIVGIVLFFATFFGEDSYIYEAVEKFLCSL